MATRAVALRRRTAVRAFRKHSKPKMKVSLAIVAGFVPYAMTLKNAYQTGGVDSVMKVAPKIIGYDGYSGKWNVKYMFDQGVMGSILGGVAVHWIANKTGINRKIGRLVPFLSL